MMNPLIIGLTLNWRDAKRTASCVSFLLREKVTHVLVQDNSEDCGNSARELGDLLPPDTPVTIIQNPANLGFASGVNQGLTWVKQHFPEAWVLLINNDANLVAGAIAKLSTALGSHPSALLGYPDIDHNGTVRGTCYYNRLTGLMTQRPIPGSFPYASGCCMLIAANKLSEPLFDANFFMYGEDAELGWRLSERPGAVVHVSETLVYHEGSASSGIGTPFYEERIVAAHWRLARHLARSSSEYRLFCLIRHVSLTLRATVRAIRFKSWLPLKALRRGWLLARFHDPMLVNICPSDHQSSTQFW